MGLLESLCLFLRSVSAGRQRLQENTYLNWTQLSFFLPLWSVFFFLAVFLGTASDCSSIAPQAKSRPHSPVAPAGQEHKQDSQHQGLGQEESTQHRDQEFGVSWAKADGALDFLQGGRRKEDGLGPGCHLLLLRPLARPLVAGAACIRAHPELTVTQGCRAGATEVSGTERRPRQKEPQSLEWRKKLARGRTRDWRSGKGRDRARGAGTLPN